MNAFQIVTFVLAMPLILAFVLAILTLHAFILSSAFDLVAVGVDLMGRGVRRITGRDKARHTMRA